MRRMLGILTMSLLLVAALATAVSAAPRIGLEHEGDYSDVGVTTVHRMADRRAVLTTTGIAASHDVTCLTPPCFDLGLDGSTVDVLQDLRIAMKFKGTDEELQAVVAVRSRASFSFEPGTLNARYPAGRGKATCARSDAGLSCDVTLHLRGKLTNATTGNAAGRSAATLRGTLEIGPGEAMWTAMHGTFFAGIFTDGFESGDVPA